jgi:transposase
MDTQQNEQLARQRASAIWRVRSGAITASQAALELGVSRKTYYEWEARAMAGMVQALSNQPAGRPVRIDVEAVQERRTLTERIQQLELDLVIAQQSAEVRRILDAYRSQQEQRAAAKTVRQKKRH